MNNAHRGNAFDQIRLIAALAVLFSHSFPLYRLDEPMIFGDSLGKFAVLIFFALSGYLVCQSWDRDPSLKRFFHRRFLRIAPGLVVAVLLTTFLVGLLATDLPALRFIAHPDTWLYVLNNSLLIASVDTLPQTFSTQPTQMFNGSLWTLRYEVLMYVALALGAALLGIRYIMPIGFLLAVICLTWLLAHDVKSQSLPLPYVWKFGLQFDAVRLSKLGAAFFGAGCLYLYRHQVKFHWPIAVAMLVVCSAIPSVVAQGLLLTFLVPYATVSLALAPPQFLAGSLTNDFSYGIYVYAYPVQQLVSEIVQARGLGWGFALIASVLLSLVFAAFSWRFVEEPALRHKPRRSAEPS